MLGRERIHEALPIAVLISSGYFFCWLTYRSEQISAKAENTKGPGHKGGWTLNVT